MRRSPLSIVSLHACVAEQVGEPAVGGRREAMVEEASEHARSGGSTGPPPASIRTMHLLRPERAYCEGREGGDRRVWRAEECAG